MGPRILAALGCAFCDLAAVHAAARSPQSIGVVPQALQAPLQRVLNTSWSLVDASSATQDQLAAAVAVVPENALLHNGTMLMQLLDRVPQATLLQIEMTGVDMLNLSAVPQRLTVCNVHQASTAIPEYVLAAVLSWNIGLPQLDAGFRRCTWKSTPNDCPRPSLHREAKGQTIGIVGYGAIGSGVAERAAALGMRAVAVTFGAPAAPPPPLAWIGNDTMLPQLLRESDYVVVACPLLPSTVNLIDAAALVQMKPAGVLINIARGPIVNESALFEALSDGRIGGAILDVWWRSWAWMAPAGGPEAWPSKYNFSALPNVWMTPHASAATEEANAESIRQVAGNLDALSRGNPLSNIVRGPTTLSV